MWCFDRACYGVRMSSLMIYIGVCFRQFSTARKAAVSFVAFDSCFFLSKTAFYLSRAAVVVSSPCRHIVLKVSFSVFSWLPSFVCPVAFYLTSVYFWSLSFIVSGTSCIFSHLFSVGSGQSCRRHSTTHHQQKKNERRCKRCQIQYKGGT